METRIGTITHYYTHLGVAVLNLTAELHLGDELHIMGRITDFDMHVTSMEIEHQKIDTALPGMEIAIKVDDYVREGDAIYKVTE